MTTVGHDEVDSASRDDRLARLELTERVRKLVMAYATFIDERDPTALPAIFAPTMTLTTPHRHCDGLEAVLEYYRGVLGGSSTAQRHFITNVSIDLDTSEGVAVASSYFLWVTAEEEVPVIGWGRYRDTFDWYDNRLVFVLKEIVLEVKTDAREGWAEVLAATLQRGA